LSSSRTCFASPAKLRATKPQPEAIASRQRSIGGQVVVAGVLELEALVGGGRELPLGEAVDAVVLDQVDHAHVAAQEVLELTHADGAGVAVAGDADGAQRVVGGQRAGARRPACARARR
jgi:hypothetical protein